MTFEKVRDIIVETINCNQEEVTMEATLSEDLAIDSLDAVELSMALEEAFEIKIQDEEMATMKRVSDIVEFLDKNTK